MTRLYRILLVSLLLALPAAGHARTGSAGVEIGGWFSQKGSGIILSFPFTDGSYGELRINADFEQVLNGRSSVPGFRAQYWYNMRLGTVNVSDELKIRPVAGPGLSLGYVRDFDKDMGFLSALGGNFGLEFFFPSSPLSLYAGIAAELGAHIVLRNRYESTMTLYTNGLRRVWQPELSVRYRF